jgi:hypothetical protein
MFYKLLNRKWIKMPTVLLLLLAVTNLSFRVKADGQVILPSGTIVPLETLGTINSESISTGEMIDFKVRSDVKVGDVVVIPAGSIAKGQVTKATPPKGLGKQGFLEVQIRSVTAVDGQNVNLASGTISKEGEDKAGLAIILGIFICILFLMIKGKSAEIAPGYQVEAVVASNATIQLK